MPKKTPAQSFKALFDMAMAGEEKERIEAEKKVRAWLKRNGKKPIDVSSILAQAVADDAADEAAKRPPPPDPRDDASVRFDPERHNAASLVEGLLKIYVTMSEHARVICSLAICLTHVHTFFSIAPRVVFVSKKEGSGKSIALEVAGRLVCRPNEEAMGTGAAIEDHFVGGPGTLMLDEAQYFDADTRTVQRIWNQGHVDDRGSKFSKMVAGKKRTVSFFGLVFLAGVSQGIGRLLAAQQRSRTLRLEMQKYTKETMPPRNYRIKEEVDIEAFNAVYSLLCSWAAKAKLSPKPPMPPELIARDADNYRGLLAIADDCGGEWPRRAREALMVLFEQQQAEDPARTMLRHAVAVCHRLGVIRIKSTNLDKELLILDLPDANWKRYRGRGGDENEHPITPSERAELLREFDVEPKTRRPVEGGKPFHGYDLSWFEEALRREDASEPTPQLRLITPSSD